MLLACLHGHARSIGCFPAEIVRTRRHVTCGIRQFERAEYSLPVVLSAAVRGLFLSSVRQKREGWIGAAKIGVPHRSPSSYEQESPGYRRPCEPPTYSAASAIRRSGNTRSGVNARLRGWDNACPTAVTVEVLLVSLERLRNLRVFEDVPHTLKYVFPFTRAQDSVGPAAQVQRLKRPTESRCARRYILVCSAASSTPSAIWPNPVPSA
jgi:hypothetical protein